MPRKSSQSTPQSRVTRSRASSQKSSSSSGAASSAIKSGASSPSPRTPVAPNSPKRAPASPDLMRDYSQASQSQGAAARSRRRSASASPVRSASASPARGDNAPAVATPATSVKRPRGRPRKNGAATPAAATPAAAKPADPGSPARAVHSPARVAAALTSPVHSKRVAAVRAQVLAAQNARADNAEEQELVEEEDTEDDVNIGADDDEFHLNDEDYEDAPKSRRRRRASAPARFARGDNDEDVHPAPLPARFTVDSGNAQDDLEDLKKMRRRWSVEHKTELWCPLCSATFSVRQHYTRHFRTFHSKDSAPTYECDQCDYSTARKDNFDVHMRRHEGKKWACSECGDEFSLPQHVSRHKRKKHPELSTPKRRLTLLSDVAAAAAAAEAEEDAE